MPSRSKPGRSQQNFIHPIQSPNDTSIITVGKARSATALAKKAFSYQRRQMFTNICCICLCPFIMVFIAVALAALFRSVISKINSSKEYLYCSNYNASNSLNIPYWAVDDNRLPALPASNFKHATTDKVFQTNFAIVRGISNNKASAQYFGNQHPCVFWYGEAHPTFQNSVYDQPQNLSGNFGRDAAYSGEPLGGWFQALANGFSKGLIDTRTITNFQMLQQRAWSIYGYGPNVDPALIGSKTNVSSTPLASVLGQPTSPAFVSPQNAATGILGTVPTRYFAEFNTLNNIDLASINATAVPWYVPVGGDDFAIDDSIAKAIQNAIAEIAKIDKKDIEGVDNGAANAAFLKISKILNSLPHGGIQFNKIDHAKKQYAMNMNYGTDIRISSATNFPQPGARLMLQLTQLTNGILRNSDVQKLGQAVITQGLRIFPQLASADITLVIDGIIGPILYPFGISFLLPIFSIMLIQEKETRVLMMMMMNGMRSHAYYISHYITFLILYFFSALVFLLTGAFGQLMLFTQTSGSVILLMFLLWGNVIIAMSFFFASLFNRSRLGLIAVFLIVLCGIIVSIALEQLFQNRDLPTVFYIWPPFAFYHALSLINEASYQPYLRPYTLSSLTPSDPVRTAAIFLAVEIPVFLLLSAYISAVLPSEFGVRKPWHFPLTEPFKYLFRSSSRSKFQVEAELAMSVQVNEAETRFEDSDVKQERARVDAGQFDPRSPLVIRHMRKVYGGRSGAKPKLAVKDATFAVEEGVVFGLLGPNGAGKTTLISILTGLFGASTGAATIGGFDIKTQTTEVYKRIGICPQFDILWDDLSVSDHLYFYARLKGISARDEKRAVQRSLRDVSLTGYDRRLTKGLSGGEKRRLSIAIALLGNPKVVFLDEPTTGLDPEVRRLVWEIINTAKSGKTIVLTTHSMEEAEALCQRIAIMAKGTLRCIANPTRLKQLYGSGFRLSFNTYEDTIRSACRFIESILPQGWIKVDSFATSATYEFPPAPGVLIRLFKEVEAHKLNVGILDWGVGQTTLEEVFVRLISENDADAD